MEKQHTVWTPKLLLRLGIALFLLYLAIHYWAAFSAFALKALRAAKPLVWGCILAYLVNILMVFYERHYGKKASASLLVRKSRRPVCLLLAFVSVLALDGAPQNCYEDRSGKDFGQGIPMLAWVAMGMSEGYAGPGWYNEDNTVTTFMENGMSTQATEENAIKVIQDRAAYFSVNPGKAVDFYWEKLRTQWNEPSYESLWINQVQQSYGEKGLLYNWFCADGQTISIMFMNQYQQLIFLGVLLGCACLFLRRDIVHCLPLLVILGGILYHLLSEAKSQYALPYFVLMVPVAALGFCGMFHCMEYHPIKHAKTNLTSPEPNSGIPGEIGKQYG